MNRVSPYFSGMNWEGVEIKLSGDLVIGSSGDRKMNLPPGAAALHCSSLGTVEGGSATRAFQLRAITPASNAPPSPHLK
jgi:hypothetical protein